MSTQSGFYYLRRAMGLAGWGFIYAAVLAVAWELYVSIKSAHYVMVATGEHWYQLHAPSLAAFQDFLTAQLVPAFAGPMSSLLLSWPAWVVYGGVGLLLLLLGRGAESPAQARRRRQAPLRDLAWHGPSAR